MATNQPVKDNRTCLQEQVQHSKVSRCLAACIEGSVL
jgi:hypothetical protein